MHLNKFLTYFLVIISLYVCTILNAQRPARYWISFKDKKHSQYSLKKPQEFLSTKAIIRRNKGTAHITEEDLPVSKIYIDSISSFGLVCINSSKWFNGALFSVPDESVLSKIRELSFIFNVEKRSNIIFPYQKSFVSKLVPVQNVSRSEVYDQPGVYGMGYNQNKMINLIGLHEKGFRGEGIRIAIIDAGFTRYNTTSFFDSLILQNRILGYKDFEEPGNSDFNKSNHGTIVLGTMAANEPGSYIGGAPDASYWLLRSENSDSEYPSEEDNWLAAIEFADSAGVDLVNTSLGYFDFDDPVYNHTLQQLNGKTLRISVAAQMAAQRGMLISVSAGNSGRSPIPYIGAPADAFDVLTVGAVDKFGNITNFSSHGIGPNIKPDIVAQGAQIPYFDFEWLAEGASGTSFSAPISGAAAACLLQAFPEKPISEIIAAIIKTSNRYSNPDFLYGHGIPDFEAAYNYLNQTQEKEEFFSFPTYINNFLIIRPNFTSAENIQIECFHISGKKVFSKTYDHNEILLSAEIQNLNSGIYLFRCTSGSEMHSFKAIKVKN